MRVVELARVANPFVRDQFTILAAKRVRVPRSEVRERYFVGAAHACVDAVDDAGEAVGRKPLRHGGGIQKGAVDALGFCAEHTVKPDSSCCHDQFNSWWGW